VITSIHLSPQGIDRRKIQSNFHSSLEMTPLYHLMSRMSKFPKTTEDNFADVTPFACVGLSRRVPVFFELSIAASFQSAKGTLMTTNSKIPSASESNPFVTMVWFFTIGLFLSAGVMAALMVLLD
jgi:hypothetical protein